ncbi:MAG: hypothetical protein ABI949_15610, partial [Ilumatobacteraceae bacterium]
THAARAGGGPWHLAVVSGRTTVTVPSATSASSRWAMLILPASALARSTRESQWISWIEH